MSKIIKKIYQVRKYNEEIDDPENLKKITVASKKGSDFNKMN